MQKFDSILPGRPLQASIPNGFRRPVCSLLSPLSAVRSGVFKPRFAAAGGKIVRLEVPAPPPGQVTFLEELAATAAGGLKLKDAKLVVAGGRGLGGPDNWHFIEETAAALGAAVGCSRPVADSGWAPTSQQVGLSGISVTSDLYIAVGISGAVQHLAGISAVRTVVAINLDPEADIFTRANYGVVGDYRQVLPAFIERVKQLRSQEEKEIVAHPVTNRHGAHQINFP